MEAARSTGSRSLSEAAESIGNDQMVSLFHSGEVLVGRVIEARKCKLADLVGEFQNEPHAGKADQQGREIEKLVFGVEFND